MPPPSISFRLVPNVRQGSGRAVGMLGGHQDLCANTLINLKEKDAKYMRYSMDRWSSGIDGPNARCHPFPGDVCTKEGRQNRSGGFGQSETMDECSGQ